jgi:two-component SAPR family response regulator
MNGLDLAARALELRPELGVVFASGYSASFHTTNGLVGELLQKPYRDEDLVHAISRARKVAPASQITNPAR